MRRPALNETISTQCNSQGQKTLKRKSDNLGEQEDLNSFKSFQLKLKNNDNRFAILP